MTNSYLYSIKVNDALESYGAKTHGSLARRVERLKRFTDQKNKSYADELKIEHARMMANQEREERVQNRVRELSAPVFLRRNLKKSNQWYAMGSPNYLKNTDTVKMKKEAYLAEPSQTVEIPMTSHSYNLRPRQESGLNLLWQAIQNGFVNVNRG